MVTSETGIAIVGMLSGGARLGAAGALTGDEDTALLLDGASGNVSFGNVFAFPRHAA